MAMFGEPTFGPDDIAFLQPAFCPYKCGEQILAREYDAHVGRFCTHKPVDCPHGCGELVPRYQHDEHKLSCPMAVLLDRAEASLRESALAEMRSALDGIYLEKKLAWARIEARGSPISPVQRQDFPMPKIAKQVRRLETDKTNLTVRLRKRALKRLSDAIAYSTADRATWKEEEEATSALRYWATLGTVTALGVEDRGARPWDLDPVDLQPLTEALRDAALTGVNENLRRSGEQLLVGILRRKLEAAMGAPSRIGLEGVNDALAATRASLSVIELVDTSEVADAISALSGEIHALTLREIGDTTRDFHEALVTGDVDLCRWFFEHEQANPDAVHPRTMLPPIVHASKVGDLSMCRLLVKERADIDARCTVDGFTALHWAVHNRTALAMSLLLHAGANPRMKDKRGQDALMKLVRRDFDRPADGCGVTWTVDRAGGYSLPGPVLQGSGEMDIDEAKVLSEADDACVGFVVHKLADGTQFISLHGKAACGTLKPTTRESADGSVAYVKAASDAVHDIRELLLYDADVSATDEGGLTALHYHQLSATGGGSPEVVSLLLRNSADVNVRDETRRATTPFLLAVASKRADLVRTMLHGAFPMPEVDARTSDNVSALELAENMGPSGFEMVDLLRSAGATAYQTCEMRLGRNTVLAYDSRLPVPP